MTQKYELLYDNTNRILKINTEPGDECIVEAGAMVSMTPNFKISSQTNGMKKALGRLFSGDSFFIQKYKSEGNGELLIAPAFLGDIKAVEINRSERYRLGKSSFLAAMGQVEMDIKSGGSKGFLSGEGLIQKEAYGVGTLFISAYGAIHEINLNEGQQYIVDSNHLVLWDSNIEYTAELANGFVGSITGGEGLVCKFTGPGRILIQTRNPQNMMQNSK